MELNQIKEIIGGFRVPVEVKRQAWIEYGKLLLACPFKQRRQIGEWVREQKLDFVQDSAERSKAKELAELILGKSPILNLSECPYSMPSDILKWLRVRAKQQQPAELKSKAVSTEEIKAEREEIREKYKEALKSWRNSVNGYIKAFGIPHHAWGGHRKGQEDESDSSPQNEHCEIVLLRGEDYGQAIYRPAEGNEVLEGREGGVLEGYAKAVRCRVVYEEVDVEVWSKVPGVSGWVTKIKKEVVQ